MHTIESSITEIKRLKHYRIFTVVIAVDSVIVRKVRYAGNPAGAQAYANDLIEVVARSLEAIGELAKTRPAGLPVLPKTHAMICRMWRAITPDMLPIIYSEDASHSLYRS